MSYGLGASFLLLAASLLKGTKEAWPVGATP